MPAFLSWIDPSTPHSVSLANTTTTAIYTVPDDTQAKALAVYIANIGTATVIVRIFRFDASTGDEFCLHLASYTRETSALIDLNSMRLDEGDKIRAKGDDDIDITVLVADYNAPGG